MDWDVFGKGYRWENFFMGWQFFVDLMQGIYLIFKFKEDVIVFVEKQGYEYFVQELNICVFIFKVYVNNFIYLFGKLKIVRIK